MHNPDVLDFIFCLTSSIQDIRADAASSNTVGAGSENKVSVTHSALTGVSLRLSKMK